MEALGRATESLSAVSESMSVKDIMKMVKEFSKESEKLDMKNELIGESLEAGLDTGEVAEDSEQIYSQICDEIGVEYENDGGPVSMQNLGANGVAAETNNNLGAGNQGL